MSGSSTDEEQQDDQLSEQTKTRVDQLATDVESIPDLGLISGAALYSRHFNQRLPFGWVDALNEIVDDSSALRSHVVDRFLQQVNWREPTDEEKGLADLLSTDQTADEFHAGSGGTSTVAMDSASAANRTDQVELLKQCIDESIANGVPLPERHLRHYRDAKESLTEEQWDDLVEYAKEKGYNLNDWVEYGTNGRYWVGRKPSSEDGNETNNDG